MTFRSERKWMFMIFIVVVVTVVVAASAFTMPTGDDAKSKHKKREKMVDETFSLMSGGNLDVDVEDMDIHIKTGAKSESSVQVYISGRDMEKARKFYKKLTFETYMDGNTLVVKCREPSITIWSNTSNINVWAEITVPQKIDVSIVTEDGDIWSEELNGNLRAITEDGDAEFADISGGTIVVSSEDGDVTAGALKATEVKLVVEDGDIDVKSVEGDKISVKASDGDIGIDRIDGKYVTIKTSDGDIEVSRIEGGEVTLNSSDGDIDIAVSGQRLVMDCSDGDLTVRLLSQLEADVSLGDGDLTLTLPKNTGADLDLRGDNVTVRNKIAMEGRLSRNHIKGSINDGGPLIRVRAGDGTIRVGEE